MFIHLFICEFMSETAAAMQTAVVSDHCPKCGRMLVGKHGYTNDCLE